MCMNKPKVSSKWVGNRLTLDKLDDYIKENFGNASIKERKSVKVTPFLQNNFGGSGDCTLTSMLTVVKYYKPELDENEVYNYIEKIAKKYLYREEWGTFSGFNKPIIKEVFKHFGIDRKVNYKLFKGIGFNYNTIIAQLNSNIPVMLSLTNDGRNYYTDHTITIVGYMVFVNEKQNEKAIFKVYDNWRTTSAYLDYDTLRSDCSICY